MAIDRQAERHAPSKRYRPWDDEQDGMAGKAQADAEKAFKPLTAEEASVLRQQNPPLSPWRVLSWQAAVGAAAALLAVLLTRRQEVAWSVLYGAATVVVPGALMARGMTSRLSSISPGVSAVSVLLWSSVKIMVSLAMLAIANRVVPALVWPALLVGLVLCMKVVVLALLWRGRRPR
jgi:ATP synthase protein I